MPLVALAAPLCVFYALLLTADTLGIFFRFDLLITALVVLNGFHPTIALLVVGCLLIYFLFSAVLSLCHMYDF